jgi:hypothetical protein
MTRGELRPSDPSIIATASLRAQFLIPQWSFLLSQAFSTSRPLDMLQSVKL